MQQKVYSCIRKQFPTECKQNPIKIRAFALITSPRKENKSHKMNWKTACLQGNALQTSPYYQQVVRW